MDGPITIKIARRRFIAAVGGATAVWPILAQAQERGLKRWRIACVLPGSPETAKPLAAALEQRLAELGYQNGRNIDLVIKIVSSPTEQNTGDRHLRRDLLRSQSPASLRRWACRSIDAARWAANLHHLRSRHEAYGNRLQTLKEIVPQLGRVAVLRASGDVNVKHAMAALEQAAPHLGMTLSGFDVHSADDLDSAFGYMQKSSMEAVIVVAGVLTYANVRRISELALQAHLPSCHAFREAVIAGGLMSIRARSHRHDPEGAGLPRQDHAWSQAGRPSCCGAEPVRQVPRISKRRPRSD